MVLWISGFCEYNSCPFTTICKLGSKSQPSRCLSRRGLARAGGWRPGALGSCKHSPSLDVGWEALAGPFLPLPPKPALLWSSYRTHLMATPIVPAPKVGGILNSSPRPSHTRSQAVSETCGSNFSSPRQGGDFPSTFFLSCPPAFSLCSPCGLSKVRIMPLRSEALGGSLVLLGESLDSLQAWRSCGLVPMMLSRALC